MGNKFRMECVITCVQYSDFLAYTLPTNRHQFDYTCVVTSKSDLATQKICEYWNVHCVTTDVFQDSAGSFCKGAGINEGLKVLKGDGMILHLDSDILLPPLTRKLIEQADLDQSCIYGFDRFLIKSFEEFSNFYVQPPLLNENKVFVHVDKMKIGTRVAPDDYGGYLPIGFAQLWNPKISGITRYPEQHTSAGRGDMLFAKNWPRSKRHLFPEVILYHLESEEVPMGTNWNGRKTAKFGVASSSKLTDETSEARII